MSPDHQLSFLFFSPLRTQSLLSLSIFFAHFTQLLKGPALDICRFLPFVLDASVVAQIEQSQRIGNQFLFHLKVQRRISFETGIVVDFNNVRPQLVIQHHIKPQNFEAHTVFDVVRLAGSVGMLQHRLNSDQRLYDHRLDLSQKIVNVVALFPHVFQGESKTALVPCIRGVKVLLKCLVMLVDRVVRQVHKQIAKVRLRRRLVLLRG